MSCNPFRLLETPHSATKIDEINSGSKSLSIELINLFSLMSHIPTNERRDGNMGGLERDNQHVVVSSLYEEESA